MEANKPLDIDEIAETMKKKLSLFDDSIFDELDPYPISELEEETEAPVLQSKEGQYIVENYKPVSTDEYGLPLYQDDDTEIMTALVQVLPNEEQKQLERAFRQSPLSWQMPIHAESRPQKPQERPLAISTLIKHYSKGVKGKKVHARSQLKKRFEYQSFADQMKIMRLFLAGTRTDREWCYRTMMHWWDDALTVDLKQAWLEHQDTLCVKTATRRLPETFIKEHQEAMGKLDYKRVCRRLAHDESFVIDKSRLTPSDYCYVIAHNHRHISDKEADHLLFGQVKQLLERRSHTIPRAFKTRFGRSVTDPLEDKTRYLPSLLFYRSVGYMIWALGQTGNTSTIIKFHRWNKTLQNNMPQYLAEEMSENDITAFMNKDFWKYQAWNWDIFTRHAEHAISEIDTEGYSEYAQNHRNDFLPYFDSSPVSAYPPYDMFTDEHFVSKPTTFDDCQF